ncbi:hypothetical protein PR048_021363 [Dryococelus australis]|uniref:Uncharacterized protein n=1 Tax=Dryococelus australis TaxID=614101 RepID=A0ABQ9GY30_9NEOP|nr:hypothetical protein PR048_021363 [Dryococelus australis]
MKEWGNGRSPRKSRRPTVSSGTNPTCENPTTRPGIEPGSPSWEASRLTSATAIPPIGRDVLGDWTALECKGGGNRSTPRKPAPASCIFQHDSRTCGNPGLNPPAIEPGSPRWEGERPGHYATEINVKMSVNVEAVFTRCEMDFRHMSNAGRPRFVHTVRLEEVIRQHINDMLSTSTHSIAREMGMSHTTTWDVLWINRRHPYRWQKNLSPPVATKGDIIEGDPTNKYRERISGSTLEENPIWRHLTDGWEQLLSNAGLNSRNTPSNFRPLDQVAGNCVTRRHRFGVRAHQGKQFSSLAVDGAALRRRTAKTSVHHTNWGRSCSGARAPNSGGHCWSGARESNSGATVAQWVENPIVGPQGATVFAKARALVSHQGEPGLRPGGAVSEIFAREPVDERPSGRLTHFQSDYSPLYHKWSRATIERANVAPPSTASLPASHQGDTGPIPSRVTPDFRMLESCQTMPSVGGSFRGSPVSPTLSFRRCSILTSITFIGSEDFDVKSHPNLFTLHSNWPVGRKRSYWSQYASSKKEHNTELKRGRMIGSRERVF